LEVTAVTAQPAHVAAALDKLGVAVWTSASAVSKITQQTALILLLQSPNKLLEKLIITQLVMEI
jgi:hypothetical protein